MGSLMARVGDAWEAVNVVGPTGATGPSGIDGLNGLDGATGPTGASGPTGSMGISTIIVADYGPDVGGTGTFATLPPDGLLPAGFASTGSPEYQMAAGESLLYQDIASPDHGTVAQFVTTVATASGWIDIGEIVGPPGEDGIQGPTGPTGPTGPIGLEVIVSPTMPTGLNEDAAWVDTSQAQAMAVAPFLPLSGGTLTGKLTMGGGADIDMTSGSVLQFPNVADTAKINLYSTTFGLGISSGTLNLFASSTVRFNGSSYNGTSWGYVNAETGGGLIIDRDECDVRYYRSGSNTYTISWISGWSGTCEFRVTSAMVTCTMEGVGFNADTAEPARVKMFAYPTNVPAPWRRLWTTIFLDQGTAAGWYDNANVEFNTDGVWLNCYDNRKFYNDQQFRCSMSWAR